MTDEVKEVVTIRGFRDTDMAFVKMSFLDGLYYGNRFYNMTPRASFLAAYRPVADALIARNQVLVACLIEDLDTIVGFSIISKDGSTLHWCFVKNRWRKQRIASSLVHKGITVYTHFTDVGRKLTSKIHNPDIGPVVFDPFKL